MEHPLVCHRRSRRYASPQLWPPQGREDSLRTQESKEWDPDKNKPEYQSDDDSNESYDDDDKGRLGIVGTGYTLIRARQIVIRDPDWVLIIL